MFFTFLNKEDSHNLNLSSLMGYTPEQILYYYLNSFIILPFDTYARAKELVENVDNPNPTLGTWIKLIEEDIKASLDLLTLKNSEYITTLGPYYYVPTNTRFYFTKNVPVQNQLGADDFATLLSLQITPAADQELHRYNKTRKNAKKAPKNADDLLQDLEMCIRALKETERLNKHINYLNKVLEMRSALVEQEICPPEPDNLPEKPDKPAEPERTALNNLIPFSRVKLKPAPKQNNNYNHEMKVYFIRYREYEKACDRYKFALESWAELSAEFHDKCMQDIQTAQSQLKTTQKMLGVYNNIIIKSYVHADYQDIKTLSTFKHYLETGRAKDLQDCMNVYEEEKHWSEIKASQERIENTIYFLQSDNEHFRYADKKMTEILTDINEKSKPEAQV
ncbi:MAG: hypothetical protein ACOX6I_10100 [Syntrophomonadaceae bacterium]|jgi:hypothetical protein